MDTILEKPETNEKVGELVAKKLEEFDLQIENCDFLEIDGDVPADTPDRHCIKVLNHQKESAYEITLDAIITQDLDAIILALETGEIQRLFGVTRVVGYFSRTTNWNKSKMGELHDRHKGNYGVGK